MKLKYSICVIASVTLASLACWNLAAQDSKEITAPEELVVDLGSSPATTLEETSAAVTVITAEELSHRSSKNIRTNLIGQGLGLITTGGGGKYKDQSVGLSVRGDSGPLLLVDGIERAISSVSSEEVEKVIILKDAAATALYGYRGINGAINVITKRGNYNSREVNVSYNHMFNFLNDVPEFVDGYTYGLAINEARANDGLTPRYNENELAALKSGQYPDLYPNVNWFDEIFRKNSNTDNLTLEFKGGGKNFRYLTMLDLVSDNGFMKNSMSPGGYNVQDKFVRGNMRINLDADLTPTTKMQVNLLGVLHEDSSPTTQDFWSLAYGTPAAAFPVKASGLYAVSSTWGTNPLGRAIDNGYYKNHERVLFSDFTLRQSLGMYVEGLEIWGRVSYDSSSNLYEDHTRTFRAVRHEPSWPADAAEPTFKDTMVGTDTQLGQGSGCNAFSLRSYFEGGARYERNFGDHNLNTQLKWSLEDTDSNGNNNHFYRQNISLWAHYGYAGKYLVDLSLVESGSNRLAPGSKWNFSPTVSAAWVISKEDALKNSSWVNYLKLRASAGHLIVDDVPGSSSEDQWLYYMQRFETVGSTYPFYDAFGTYYFTTTRLGRFATENPGIVYANKFDLGIEGRFFEGLSFSADAYYQRRGGLWVDASKKYSSIIGKSAPYENMGINDYWGAEFGVNYNRNFGDVTVLIGGNFNYNTSKVVEMYEEDRYSDNLIRTGLRVGQNFGMKAIGYFKDEADIANSPQQTFSAVRPGDIKYEDVNKDGVVDANDEIAMGYGSIPEIYFNFNLGFEWKGLGVYALFQGLSHYTCFLTTENVFQPLVSNRNISQYYYDNRWTPSTPDAKFPRLSSASNNNNYRNNSMVLQDRTYLKLRNLEVYYDVPGRLVKNLGVVKGAKFYVQGNDLFSFDKFEICDPEAYGTSQLYRSIVLGLRLRF